MFFLQNESDDLFNCKFYFHRSFTYRFNLLQLLLSILKAARLGRHEKKLRFNIGLASWKIYQSGVDFLLDLFLEARNFIASC